MILTEAQAKDNLYKVVTILLKRQMTSIETRELDIAIGTLELATAKDTHDKTMGILNEHTK